MATPWAQIRLARYRASKTQVSLNNTWEDFVATATDGGSATGDAIGEVFDVGVDFGF